MCFNLNVPSLNFSILVPVEHENGGLKESGFSTIKPIEAFGFVFIILILFWFCCQVFSLAVDYNPQGMNVLL